MSVPRIEGRGRPGLAAREVADLLLPEARGRRFWALVAFAALPFAASVWMTLTGGPLGLALLIASGAWAWRFVWWARPANTRLHVRRASRAGALREPVTFTADADGLTWRWTSRVVHLRGDAVRSWEDVGSVLVVDETAGQVRWAIAKRWFDDPATPGAWLGAHVGPAGTVLG